VSKTTTLPDSILIRIPFLIFAHIADEEKQITAREADAFTRLLEQTNWCTSATLKHALQSTAEQYAELWKAYASGEIVADADHLADAMLTLQHACRPDEIAAIHRDLGYLASEIAGASGGLMGSVRAAKRKLAAREFVVGLMKVTATAAETTSAAANPSTTAATKAVPDDMPVASPGISAAELWPLASLNADNLRVWGKGKTHVRCVKIIDETHDVKTFKFASVEPHLFLYKPGQFATLELPIDGKTVRRSYTISSTPSRPHTMSITVKRVPGGLVSNWLHDNMKEGHEIFLSGPNGKFNLFDIPARKLLLLSGGSGITPVMSMLRWLMDTNADCDAIFISSARTPNDVIFQRELELYDSQFPHLKVAVTCSAHQHGKHWLGYTGHLNRRMIEMIAPDFLERTAYVCGPPFFMDAMKQTLLEMGLPPERYFQESFGGAPPAKAAAGGPAATAAAPVASSVPPPQAKAAAAPAVASPPPVVSVAPATAAPPATAVPPAPAAKPANAGGVVVFKQSGKEVVCADGAMILESAEAAGLELNSSCRAGSCGTCKQKKIEGVVKMDVTDGLTEAELAEGYVLICIGTPEGRVVLDA
jgi:ferredoxin-NADP reductase